MAGSRRSSFIWNLVCWSVVIPLSWLVMRETQLYRYLWRSVLDFDSVEVFVERMYAAGFVDVEVRTVPGWQRGVLHSFRARRAAAPLDRAHSRRAGCRAGTGGPYGMPGPPARGSLAPGERRVVVVGGGIAGLAAATGAGRARRLACSLIEAEPQLGGRVRAWPVDHDGTRDGTMSRGFHAFFRQYYNLRALLRRSDPAWSG